jgi:hypothetical protein
MEMPYIHSPLANPPTIKVKKAATAKLSKILSSNASLID